MVPSILFGRNLHPHFPRIRGDGPISLRFSKLVIRFSPYSRGWSVPKLLFAWELPIFPVFAGMVPPSIRTVIPSFNFPRIRGDDPTSCGLPLMKRRFSPYSRGWSLQWRGRTARRSIFPVFAGMVPALAVFANAGIHFPRIRGDGPMKIAVMVIGP